MNFLKALFGVADDTAKASKTADEEKRFDLMKYDGVKAMKMGQFDYAQRCFEEALKVKDDAEVHDYLSRVLVRQDKFDEAIAQLELLAAAAPDNLSVLHTMAHVAYMKEDYNLMGEICERAANLDPTSATTSYLHAQAALGQGDLVGGIARLTKAVAQDDSHADARLLRGQTLLRMGDAEGAGRDADWLAEHVGDQEDVLLLQARVAHLKGNDDDALLIYNKVVDLNPFMLEAYTERGQIHYQRGNKAEAEADMKKMLELNPQQLADVSGDYSAEGVEQQMKRAYSMLNPFGL